MRCAPANQMKPRSTRYLNKVIKNLSVTAILWTRMHGSHITAIGKVVISVLLPPCVWEVTNDIYQTKWRGLCVTFTTPLYHNRSM